MKHEQDIRFLNAFERLFSENELNNLGRETGFLKRRRQVTPQKFCMALVSALGAGTTNSIADVHRQFNHMHSTNIRLKPFHKQLVKMAAPEFMREVFEKALALHLPDMFALREQYQNSFKRIILQDGTSFAVHDDLMLHFPGRFNAHTPAAVELHVTYDVFKGQPDCVNLTEDTAPERDYLPSATSLADCLLMADAGYFSKGYIQQLQDAHAYFILRISNSVNPMAVCPKSQQIKPLKSWLKELPEKGLLDLDVHWPDGPTYRCVAFAALDHKKRHILVCTNLSREQFSADVVGDLYRVRWQIELLFKEWKSMNNLSKFDTGRATIVETLIWGSLLAATLKRWLISAAEKRANRVLSLFTGAKSAHLWWLPFCVDIARSRGAKLAMALDEALTFLTQQCQRQNLKRDQKTGVFKLLSNPLKSLG
ncbi:MAG: IS4 family transposase [Rheinheimera sp.]|nr:IS4 family transposase [Rheinheimera sp.]MDZ7904335.1 IS4 family transposase [Rheinheimera sp.]